MRSCIQQLNSDDAAIGVVIENDVRRDFGAFENAAAGKPDIGGVVVGLILNRRGHSGSRASLSKNTVKIRTSWAVSKHATRRMRPPNSGMARNRRSTPRL
uniref:Uncharacterized protein n=1 Tax=Rhodopseudomonas palustris (strain BisA53) TaxID=316055 RepID=Q07TF0_RHOP5